MAIRHRRSRRNRRLRKLKEQAQALLENLEDKDLNFILDNLDELSNLILEPSPPSLDQVSSKPSRNLSPDPPSPSYSPVIPAEDALPPSPASSTSSVEFLEEVSPSSPAENNSRESSSSPGNIHPASPASSTTSSIEESPTPSPPETKPTDPPSSVSLADLIAHFPHPKHFSSESYSIGSYGFDFNEFKTIISLAPPDYGILVYLPGTPAPYLVPVRFLYQFFRRFSAIVDEIHQT